MAKHRSDLDQKHREEEFEKKRIENQQRIEHEIYSLNNLSDSDIYNGVEYILGVEDFSPMSFDYDVQVRAPKSEDEEESMSEFEDPHATECYAYISFEGTWDPRDAVSYSAQYDDSYIWPDDDDPSQFSGVMIMTYDTLSRIRQRENARRQREWDEEEMMYGHDYEA